MINSSNTIGDYFIGQPWIPLIGMDERVDFITKNKIFSDALPVRETFQNILSLALKNFGSLIWNEGFTLVETTWYIAKFLGQLAHVILESETEKHPQFSFVPQTGM